jgi:phosphoesterase RecJ-like protein
MDKIDTILEGVTTVAIAGHVNPDGDCMGSCMGMYLYLKANYPKLMADVYMGEARPVFGHIDDLQVIRHEVTKPDKEYDLLLLFDVSCEDRIAVATPFLKRAKKSVCIDHHVTNEGVCDVNHIIPEASSTCEVLYELLDQEKITLAVATALYTGIIHDTGVFQYSNTSGKTMRIAGVLLDLGVDANTIIEGSFYERTYVQNQILGRTLLESILVLDGQCIIGIVRQKEMDFYGVTSKDLDGIVNQLRLTKGVEVAMFLYATGPQQFKVSMRSNGEVNVSSIAAFFGGGGHVMAAGCTMEGSVYDVINSLTFYIEKALEMETEK